MDLAVGIQPLQVVVRGHQIEQACQAALVIQFQAGFVFIGIHPLLGPTGFLNPLRGRLQLGSFRLGLGGGHSRGGGGSAGRIRRFSLRRELTQGQQGVGRHGDRNAGQAFDQVGNGRQVLPPRHAQRDPADVRGQQLGVLKRDRLAGETRHVVEHHQLRFVLVGPQLRIGFVRALQHLAVVGFGFFLIDTGAAHHRQSDEQDQHMLQLVHGVYFLRGSR